MIFSFNEQFANTNLKCEGYFFTFHRWNIIYLLYKSKYSLIYLPRISHMVTSWRRSWFWNISGYANVTHKLSSTKCCQVKLFFKSTFHCHLSSTKFWSVTTSTFTLQFLNKFPNTRILFFRLELEFELKSINLLKLLQFMFNKYTIPQNRNFHLLSCFKRISPQTYHLKYF